MSLVIKDDKILKVMKSVFPFSRYREEQEDVIFKIVKAFLTDKKYVVLEAPTGSGKSVIAYTAAKTIQILCEDEKSTRGPYTLTSVKTKSLQQQYKNSLDLPLIWAGPNYECALFPDDKNHYWGSGTCLKKKCPAYDQCEYALSLKEFMEADMSITNYAYYLNAEYIHSNISVIDECHNLEEALCAWMTVEMSTRYLDRYLGQLLSEGMLSPDSVDLVHRVTMLIIDIDDEKPNWLPNLRELADGLYKAIVQIYVIIERRIKSLQGQNRDLRRLSLENRVKLTTYSKISKYFKNFGQKLMLLAKLETDWVVASRTEDISNDKRTYPKTCIKPLQVHEVSQTRFFNRSNFFLLMSATICNHEVFLKYLGIPSDNCEYIQMSSYFPAENRPIISINDIGKFSWSKREWQLPEFTYYLDLIIESQFEGVRGIIHSASYDNAKYIEENSRYVHRMKFPTSDELTEIIPLLEERNDTIVVSPSVVEGLDLKGDLCRFSIFFKVPWSSLGDKWVKTRSSDNDWYVRDAIIKIIQGSGRGTRSKEDHSVTVIMDAHFLRMFYRNSNFFPQWYLDAVNIISVKK